MTMEGSTGEDTHAGSNQGERNGRRGSLDLPGRAILLADRYELEDKLGHGGMSEVWLGRDVRLGREVAVKLLRAELATEHDFHERFRREAHNSAALNHPAIVGVYDTGETDSPHGPLPYIVMEYVEGRTLREILVENGPIEPEPTMEIMADVCAALDFSHRHGIVHRDVKPANVMITKTGAVKVMDFGIARAIHDAHAVMTLPRSVIGTAHYLAPEQARGEGADARSDVYSAGCTLYELLTGRPPFTGDSAVAITYQHVREDPLPPSVLNPAIRSELDAVVLKALAKGPANRYQTAADMRSDLVRVLTHQRPQAPKVLTEDELVTPPATPRRAADFDPGEQTSHRRPRNPAPFFLALGAAAILFLLWQFSPFDAEPVHAIPDVVGQPYLTAENHLKEAGFRNIERHAVACWARAYGQKPPCDRDNYGRVLATDPTEGTKVATSTTIVVEIGQAPRRLEMPQLVGKKQSEVKQILARKRLLLNPNIEQVENKDPTRAGRVVTQYPESGITVAQGDTVTLSAYQQPIMVQVVNYTGKSEETARAGLEGAGFKVAAEVVRSSKAKGTVVSQRPDSGEAVKGSTVIIELSDGAERPMEMPDLIDMTEHQARSVLSDSGHIGDVHIEKIDLDEWDQGDNGLVINTSPEFGTTLKIADPVTLHVGEYRQDDEETDPPTTTSPSPPPTTGPPRPPTPTRTERKRARKSRRTT